MAGIGSKTHDFDDIVFRRDDNSFSDVGENSQSSCTGVRENPGQVLLHDALIKRLLVEVSYVFAPPCH